MTTDSNPPTTGDRWARLLEGDVCGELSEAERRELDALAAESEEARQVLAVLSGIGAHAPSDLTPSVGDAHLIDAVLEQHGQARRQRKTLVWLAAAAVLVPLAAAAAYLPWAGRADAPMPSKNASAAKPSAIAHHPPRPGADRGEPASRSEPPAASTSVSAQPSGSSAAAPSAAELLARAQQARSAGDYGTAIGHYQQLMRFYPRSSEGQLAQLSLAQLYLAQGNAAAALQGFEAYGRSGGALTQEAQYGKIQALRSLGRTAEAEAEIRRFLARYPKSLQAATLRRQLGAHGAPQ
jgi:TolA-binding protein